MNANYENIFNGSLLDDLTPVEILAYGTLVHNSNDKLLSEWKGKKTSE